MSTARQTSVIARSEWRLIFRNKTVLLSATLMPLAFAGFFLLQNDDSVNAAVALQSIILTMFSLMTVYLTVTLTAVSRRQDLYLKRLRSGESSDAAIFTGLVLPPAMLCLAQVIVVFAGLFALGVPLPEQPWWIVVAAIGSILSSLAVGVATAAITTNATAAQMTTVPYFLLLLGTVFATPFVDHRLMDLTPGGAVVTLVRLAYELPTAGSSWGAAVGLALWTYLGIYLARRHFRWEPRA